MNKIVMLLIVALLAIIGTTQADAYYLEITPGGALDATGQSTLYFNLVFNPEGTVNLDTYTFNLLYDNSELSWNSGATSTFAPSPLISQLLGPLDGTTSGVVGNFNAATFMGEATVSSPFTLATVAFDVGSPLQDGSADVSFDTAQDNRFGFTVNSQATLMSNISVSGTGPDVYNVAVVPEPISSALFVIGGATLGVRRYWKKRMTA